MARTCGPRTIPRDLLKQGIAEGKRIRKYFFGNFYPLSRPARSARVVVMQYHRPEEHDGMVMAFRRDQSAYLACEGRLREIDPAQDYEVTIYRTYDARETRHPERLRAQAVAAGNNGMPRFSPGRVSQCRQPGKSSP